jgi:hypothetical protein
LGAFVEGRLASYAICSYEDGWIHVLYQMTAAGLQEWHPCKALDFTITRRLSTDPAVNAVSMGLAPLVPNQGLHDYKIRMGFDFEPQWSVIRLHPVLEKTLTGRLGTLAFRAAAGMYGAQSQTFRMAAAVLDGAARTRRQVRCAPGSAATSGTVSGVSADGP